MERLEHFAAHIAQWRRWQETGREQRREGLIGFAAGQQSPRRQLDGELAVLGTGPAARVIRDGRRQSEGGRRGIAESQREHRRERLGPRAR